MIRRSWSLWVALTSEREPATSLAWVRVLMSVVLLWDLGVVGAYGLPPFLWAPAEAGGVADVYAYRTVPEVYRWLGPGLGVAYGPAVAWTLYGLCVAAAAAFGAGIATRSSGVVLLVVYAQTALVNTASDRAIDRMIRIVLLLLIWSRSGDALSVDAWRRTGSWWGDGRLGPAWPRHLLVGQLVLLYWAAGVSKFAAAWLPWGGYAALYLILQDPILAVTDFGWLARTPAYPLTQVATAVSHAWEWTIPVLLLAGWYRRTPERPGRLRALFLRLRVWEVFVVLGIVFHIGLGLTLRLGIFPAAMLAFYPAFFRPAAPNRLRSAPPSSTTRVTSDSPADRRRTGVVAP